MKDNNKIIIVNNLLALAKQSKLNYKQKSKILKIIKNLSIATEKQKERFIIYYGLDDNGVRISNLTAIAKLDGCTMSAVRSSVISIKNKLTRLDKEFEIFKEIIGECEDIKE